MSRLLMPILEAGALFQMSRSKTYRLAQAGKFPVEVLYTGSKPMVRQADVDRALSGEPSRLQVVASEPTPARASGAMGDAMALVDMQIAYWQAQKAVLAAHQAADQGNGHNEARAAS